eukprot:TRINITY_DN13400_c0_g1_i1.p1 TRINITY_DN13400_c0_g1~~TRINITY_DN13400_c0_g1_i1.p1  ORF type:complete len:206 (+),score=16.81 TRINITY_DN13400_c0_g1_i1:60-620(+)
MAQVHPFTVTEHSSLPTLDCIIGHECSKRSLQEWIVLPMRFPQLFTGLRIPFSNILLYGPSGCGKSSLIQAIAHSAQCKLLTIDVSALCSQWFAGDSERHIKRCFEYAITIAPCVIHIQDIDVYCDYDPCRRRMKTELLVQMQQLRHEHGVQVLASTNCPWALDSAMLRRCERRLYIEAPALEHRA